MNMAIEITTPHQSNKSDVLRAVLLKIAQAPVLGKGMMGGYVIMHGTNEEIHYHAIIK